MQINILPPSHPSSFTAAMFPEISQSARDWVKNQFQAASSVFANAGQQFLDHAKSLYQTLNSETLHRATRKFARSVNGMLHPNSVYYIDDIRQIQTAQPVMQRYIMANPVIRDIYHRQLCDGFSDTYVDAEPGKIADDHYDYRRVMNNIVIPGTEETGINWSVTTYNEELREGDRELSFIEQCDVLDTWYVVEQAMLAKIDPTDIFNSELGT